MGKQTYTRAGAGSSSAQSVHSLQLIDADDADRFLSDDDRYQDHAEEMTDDNPPSYDAVISDNLGKAATSNTTHSRNQAISATRLIDADYTVPGGRRAQSVKSSTRNTRVVTLQPSLSRYDAELTALIAQQIRLPPRPQLTINGSHTESSNNNKDNKKQSNTVTDFDFRLDLAETLLCGWENPEMTQWHTVRISDDCDGIKTYRGTRTKTLKWKGSKGAKNPSLARTSQEPQDFLQDDLEDSPLYRDEEQGANHDEADHDRLMSEGHGSLLQWCQRFCNDPSPVKSFTLIRHVHNFNQKAMIDYLHSQIRETNYRGQIHMNMEVVNGNLTIYSPHWINKLRNNGFVFWICIILQLWIITWPIIWLLEKRYEVVYSCWYASHTIDGDNNPIPARRYARGRDEFALSQFWAPAVKQAAWSRRQDSEVILLDDAQRLQGLTTAQILQARTCGSEAELERRRRVDRGDGTFVDSIVGLARGVSEVRQEWNMTMGWGENR